MGKTHKPVYGPHIMWIAVEVYDGKPTRVISENREWFQPAAKIISARLMTMEELIHHGDETAWKFL